METHPSPGPQETFFRKGRPWFLIGVAAGPRRWMDVSIELEFPPLPGSPWTPLCLRPQNIGQAPYSQTCTFLHNCCFRQSPPVYPLSTPFPIYQLVPRKGIPTETDFPALWEEKNNAKSVSVLHTAGYSVLLSSYVKINADS